ncbi:hypothetical protein ASG87_01110 [Frateuria sp. Soil773]|nr:hypothetical protein ASG87_01110 [Frateuria sp. Soil773]
MVWAAVSMACGAWGLFLYEPPISYLGFCSMTCFAWYWAYAALPVLPDRARIGDVYEGFRAMPPGRPSHASLVGLLGIVLMIAAVAFRFR